MDTGDRGGFTIIEVVLVLAIAGLIFLMVFIALPALQRSQRDTQRRDDMARLSSMLTQYQTNNNGRLPGDGVCDLEPDETTIAKLDAKTGTNATACNFIRNYMNSSTASDGDDSEFLDPSGEPYRLTIKTLQAGEEQEATTTDFTKRRVYLVLGARCEGEKAVKSGGKRDYAIVYKLEGAGTYCNDNGS